MFIADVYNMHMEQFSEFDNYTFVLYLWIQETAEKEEISAMPTFKFYKNGAKVSHYHIASIIAQKWSLLVFVSVNFLNFLLEHGMFTEGFQPQTFCTN